MIDFTHLHVHTQFSILDGAASIESLMEKAKENGMTALAITDHGNMYGVLKFVSEAKRYKIKPIIGCEVYVAEGNRFSKKGKEDRSGYHLILLAKNKIGYDNLIKLCSFGFLEGFYYTPRIDKELLRKYKEGIIALSACLGGEIPSSVTNKSKEKAEEVLKEYLDIFGGDFYLELQQHGLSEQKKVNEVFVELGKKYNVKLVATNDVHFVNKEDAEAHNILICLNTGKDIDEEQNLAYSGQEYLKTPEEMAELFSDVPEAITNTQEIVGKIEEINLLQNVILPVFPLPEGFSSEGEYLKHLSYKGAEKHYPELTQEIKERLDYELSVINNMGFAGYFLIVQDFISEARKMDVLVGPGRGSAAGSVVAYCIGITNIDPIKYSLLFERFLNPERISMPDIDIDFDDYGRDRVIDYVVNKYGKERVAQIITFGTMAARSSIRDVARVLKLPLSEADRLAKLVPEGPGVDLKRTFNAVKELANEKENGSPLVKKTLTFAEILEGSARHTGTHACGVIIGRDDLINYVPLCISKDSDLMITQYEGKLVESVGMLKMDFLGLKTLSIIKDAIENIYQRHGVKIDIENIPMDDSKTFELYQRGDTVGTFQFESDNMRTHLKELKPTDIEDLIAMNALYRPGPMDHIPSFINRKQGREKIEYPHPMLEIILKATYGIMVYQEQIMQTAQIMGGFSLSSADILRRAMGKKKKDIMEQQKDVFLKGAEEKGIDKVKAQEVFELMEKFAEYGFNRSHSAAYSVVAYQTGYLKAHYPAEYMAAVLTHNLNDIKKITYFIDECRRQGILVLGPDINESKLNFVVNDKGEIRFGLAAVKGIGEAAVQSIVKETEKNGRFSDIFDFARRVNLQSVNKRCFESLAYAGAFDSFGSHRSQYFYQENSEDTVFIEKIIKHANNYQSRQDQNQHSLFGENTDELQIPSLEMPACELWSKLDQLKHEKEVTGFYLSGHPLDGFKLEVDNYCNVYIADINKDLRKFKNKEIRFAGIVTAVSHKTTKKGDLFGVFSMEDYTDSIKLSLFSEEYLERKHFMQEGQFLYIRAKVQNRSYNEKQEQLEVRIQSITLLSEVLDKFTRNISIQLPLTDVNENFIKEASDIVKSHPGKCNLKFTVVDAVDDIKVNMPSKKFKVSGSGFLRAFTKASDMKYELS